MLSKGNPPYHPRDRPPAQDRQADQLHRGRGRGAEHDAVDVDGVDAVGDEALVQNQQFILFARR